MEKLEEVPGGSWPQFMYNGESVVGQVGNSGPWYEIGVGQTIRFNRHGAFTVTKKLLTFARLEVVLPRKGWNCMVSTHSLKLPLNKCVTVRRRFYHVRSINPYDRDRFGKTPTKSSLIKRAY
tara:strand:- start:503 stop:868 length:366 start_codon:yes stop_codon:yes gene_type:complete